MQQSLIRSLFAVMLVFAGLLTTVAPTGAEGTTQSKPHTIVTSDGRVIKRVRLPASEALESAAHEGSGETLANELDAGQDEEADVAPIGGAEGDATPETIIGPDNRFQVNAGVYPYRAIAHITNSFTSCTGFLISPNTVATTGHCIFSSSTGWATNVRVTPGRNGTLAPYGTCQAKWMASVVGWTQSFNKDYDYGVIRLNCSAGNNTGWFGFRWQSATHTGNPNYVAGYAADKGFGTIWRSNDVVRTTTARRLFYGNDTSGGQGGSPVWDNNACSPCAVAIHAQGVDASGWNSGTRINQAVFNNLVSWKNAP